MLCDEINQHNFEVSAPLLVSSSVSVDMKNTLFFKLKAILSFSIIRLWLRPDHNLKRKEEWQNGI